MEQACENGDVATLKRILVDGHVNPGDHIYSDYPICIACEYGNLEIVQLLLADSRVDPSANNNEAICLASAYGHVEIVKLLLADKRVNPKGENGIRIDDNGLIVDIVMFDDILCDVVDEKIDSIKDDNLREKYLKWLYRIGGEKYTLARDLLKEPK